MQENPMNIQEWLPHLLARPAADPLDWESYCVTMGDSTRGKALWRDIDATQAYEDGRACPLLPTPSQDADRIGSKIWGLYP